MFVFTMNKNGLKKAAVAVASAALLLVCAFTVTGALGDKAAATTVTAEGTTKNLKVKDTDDMVTFLLSYGVEADLASAKVDKVKVPKKWDDSFIAFNEVIKQSGLDLSKCKGKTVEKWEFAAPNRSTETETAYAILLVRSKKVVGGYILSRPSGEVTALAAQSAQTPQAESQTTMAPAEQQAETAQTGGQLSADQQAQIQAAGEAVGLTDEQIQAAAAAIEQAAAEAGAAPTE